MRLAEEGGLGGKVDVLLEQVGSRHEGDQEVNAEHDDGRPDSPGRRERCERKHPQQIPGHRPAERDCQGTEHERRRRQPVQPAACDRDRAAADDAQQRHLHGQVQRRRLPALPKGQAEQVRQADRGDETALGGEVGVWSRRRSPTQPPARPRRRGRPRIRPRRCPAARNRGTSTAAEALIEDGQHQRCTGRPRQRRGAQAEVDREDHEEQHQSVVVVGRQAPDEHDRVEADKGDG